MNKYINKTLVGAMAVAALLTTSCKGDYLDTMPTESVGKAETLGSAENVYKALNGIARTMSCQQYAYSQGCAGENRIITIYENYASQDYFYNYYAQGWAPIMNLKYSSRNNTSYCNYPFNYYYNIIGQANAIICNIDNATGTESLKAFDKASALTFRAYAYEKLLHYYAPRWQDSGNGTAEAFPLRIDESTGELAPATMAEVYAQIYKDCDEAIALFAQSEDNRDPSETWIANANVAQAVYARAALTKQDYATALTHAKEARKGFPLMSNDDYQKGFCHPTSEWIFGSYGDAQENNWYWSYGTQYACNGYYGNQSYNGAGSMDRELYTQIPDNDARKALFLTEDKFAADSTFCGIDVNDPKDVDTEYGWLGLNLNEKGNPYVSNYELWSKVYEYIASMDAKGEGDPAYGSGAAYLGGQLKFRVFDTPGVGYLPFIRSSEMVLIEAEANYFLGNEAAAQAALVELNASTDRNPDYTCDKTGADLWKEIRNYRALELWGEGFGFSDYKRWNMDIDRKGFDKGGNANAAIAVKIPASDPNWTWVIPQYETDYNDAYKDTTDPNN